MMIAMKIEPSDNVIQLLPYQVRAAEANPNSVIGEADLAVLHDKRHWRWMHRMNELSIAPSPRAGQILPPDAPPSIDLGAAMIPQQLQGLT